MAAWRSHEDRIGNCCAANSHGVGAERQGPLTALAPENEQHGGDHAAPVLIGRRVPHETPEPAAATGVTAGSSGIVPETVSGLVGSTGFEEHTFSPGNTAIAQTGGAESGALSPEPAAGTGLDPGLAFVSRQWPGLTAEQRLRIVEIATAVALEPTHATR